MKIKGIDLFIIIMVIFFVGLIWLSIAFGSKEADSQIGKYEKCMQLTDKYSADICLQLSKDVINN